MISEPLLPLFQGIVVAAEHTGSPAGLGRLRDDAQQLSLYMRDAPDYTVYGKVSLCQEWLLRRKADPEANLDVGTMVKVIDTVGDAEPPFSFMRIQDPSLRDLAVGAQVGILSLKPAVRVAPLPGDTHWLSTLQDRYRARGFSEDETYQLLGHEIVDRMLQRQFLGLFPLRWPDWAPFGAFGQERYGFLRVETQPSEAVVWVDDVSWGPSPQERGIRSGEYSIKASKKTEGRVLAGADKVSVTPGGRATTRLDLA